MSYAELRTIYETGKIPDSKTVEDTFKFYVLREMQNREGANKGFIRSTETLAVTGGVGV